VIRGNYPATAFRTGKPVIVDGFGEGDRPVRAGAIEAAMYIPLGDYGTISVGSTEVNAFEPTDRELAGILAENATVALEGALRETTLETERNRLASLFENIPDPTVRVEFEDGDPIVDAVNPAFESTFGYAEAAVTGRSLDDVIVPPRDLTDARTYNERIQAGESLHAEVRRETVDGVRDFLLHVVPRSREAATVGYAIYTDITERREHERELARQNERLEEFASVVSHDLRNPLNVAEGQLELARTSTPSSAPTNGWSHASRGSSIWRDTAGPSGRRAPSNSPTSRGGRGRASRRGRLGSNSSRDSQPSRPTPSGSVSCSRTSSRTR
jgi:PAS domain S-box-containing protein